MIKDYKRKAEMIKMHESGVPYKEIGKAFGISRQRVCMIIGKETKGYFKPITSENCIYPNLRKWMNDNRLTISGLSRRVYDDTHPVHQSNISRFIKGKNPYVNKHIIDKYLTVTGLTHEELFATDKE